MEVAGRWDDIASHSLDGLGNEGGWAAVGGGLDGLLKIPRKGLRTALVTGSSEGAAVGIRRHDVLDSCNGAGQGTPGGVPGNVGGQDASAGIGMAQGEHFVSARVAAGEHDGGFYGFGPTVGEKGALEVPGSHVGQTPRCFHLVFGQIEGGGMAQNPRLLANPFHHFRMAVAQ